MLARRESNPGISAGLDDGCLAHVKPAKRGSRSDPTGGGLSLSLASLTPHRAVSRAVDPVDPALHLAGRLVSSRIIRATHHGSELRTAHPYTLTQLLGGCTPRHTSVAAAGICDLARAVENLQS